jgi:WD40 repeat protein
MLWDMSAQTMIKQPFPTSEQIVNPIAFSRDGRTLAAGGGNGTLFLWDVPSHRMITNFVAHRSVVEWGDFSRDGKLFVTASYDHSLKLWETAHWRELATFRVIWMRSTVSRFPRTAQGSRAPALMAR